MNFNYSTKIFSRYYTVVIVLVFVVGVVASAFTFVKVSKSTQEELLENSASLASAFETSAVASLSGNDKDLRKPEYISLKNKLEKITKINDEIRFVYLWGRNAGGEVYFMVDSEPSTSPDYSPPGQVYEEATELDHAMFLEKLPSSIEMNTDRWGTWLSALTPIEDPETGELLAVMGMDMSASSYFRTIYIYTSIPIITTIFVLALIVVGLVLRRREQDFLTFKSELVAIASHEIRSPLTGISWLASGLLKNAVIMTQSEKEDITIIKNKSEELLLTINDLLDGTTTEKVSKKNLVKKSINMKTLFEEILENSSLILEEKNNQLIIDDSITSQVCVPGDAPSIKRMFNNLVSNAIKYSKNGGIVQVGVSGGLKKYTFWIKDEGIGMSPKDQLKIFDGFFRADNAKKVTQNGTGLGLHYVRQIAELHDGRVWCKSEEGVGSTFYVELPKV